MRLAHSVFRNGGGCRDGGSAVVEFVLVAVLLIPLFLGVVQVGLVLHARNVLVADAAEGARAAAVRGARLQDGERLCARLVREALSGAIDTGTQPCRATVVAGSAGQPPLVRMDVHATLPLTFIPLGTVHLDVAARAVREPQ